MHNFSELADNAVDTAAITDLNVTTDKLAATPVTTAKIANSAVTFAKTNFSDGVPGAKLTSASVTLLNLPIIL